MPLALLAILVTAGMIDRPAQAACVEQVPADAFVDDLSGLPETIRDDLTILVQAPMGARGGPLLQTDAPTAAERDDPLTRFYRAALVNGRWLVQFEVSLFSGVRTIVYTAGGDGRFHRDPWRYFGGPACESLNAALNGVTSPPGGGRSGPPQR